MFVVMASIVIDFVFIVIVVYLILGRWTNDAPGAMAPEGWKVQRKGSWFHSRWDAYDPIKGQWSGWQCSRKSEAIDQAWSIASLDHTMSRIEEASSKYPKK